MIKIGFVSDLVSASGPARGIGVYSQNLLNHLQQIGSHQGFEITTVPNTPKLFSNFQLIHYSSFDLFYPTLSFFTPKPFVVTVHDVIPLEFPQNYPVGLKGRLNLERQKISLKQAGRIITDSYASVKSIKKHLHIPDSKINMIYLGAPKEFTQKIKPDRLVGVKKRFHLPDKYILNIGDINWNKNIPGLINACQSLKIPLVLAGRPYGSISKMDFSHPSLKSISNLPKLLDQPGITLLSNLDNTQIAAVMQLATIYCQPSFAEGFGLGVLQALTSGIPVACSETHSLPEVAGDAAVYFDPSKPDQIAKTLDELWHNTALRRSLAVSGLKQAAKFSWETTAGQTLAVYQSLL